MYVIILNYTKLLNYSQVRASVSGSRCVSQHTCARWSYVIGRCRGACYRWTEV